MVAYQARAPSITYKGTWTNVSTAAASGDRYRYEDVRRSAKLTFTGRAVIYVHRDRHRWAGQGLTRRRPGRPPEPRQ
jgi:hypothetical protein